MKILVAEDDPVSRKILSATLERLGHEVVAVNDGAAGWEACRRQHFHVVVSDWMMPELDGLALCQKVRAESQRDYNYFILLTARTGQENYRQAMDAGVDDFLPKPFNRDELAARLRVAQRILDFIRQVRQLKQLMPICSYCKKIRDDKDYWHQIESYIHAHTGADFSHSICPDCYEKYVKPQIGTLDSGSSGRTNEP